MKRSTSPLGGADNRPRIHIQMAAEGASWQLGLGARAGQSCRAATPGAALDEALALVGHKAAVVIFGPVPGVDRGGQA